MHSEHEHRRCDKEDTRRPHPSSQPSSVTSRLNRPTAAFMTRMSSFSSFLKLSANETTDENLDRSTSRSSMFFSPVSSFIPDCDIQCVSHSLGPAQALIRHNFLPQLSRLTRPRSLPSSSRATSSTASAVSRESFSSSAFLLLSVRPQVHTMCSANSDTISCRVQAMPPTPGLRVTTTGSTARRATSPLVNTTIRRSVSSLGFSPIHTAAIHRLDVSITNSMHE